MLEVDAATSGCSSAPLLLSRFLPPQDGGLRPGNPQLWLLELCPSAHVGDESALPSYPCRLVWCRLDGAMALRLTRALHSYAQAGRTVIASMKQPSNRMFSFFTHLLLAAEGNPIYYGPASTALSYFDSCGFSPSPDSSPAEFFLVRVPSLAAPAPDVH